ncbi:putative mediator of RNA polymerase II transcription subunit 26, partial [Teleopsis dalmanni]|uniref:putative mediator of RNA polymerase II transcription subunit 26 n=1 Tax=Teleopsis dalmanni TaxID=139649 RepID=UPI0018CEFB2A
METHIMTQQSQHRMPAPPCCAICGTQDQLLRCAKCKTVYYCCTGHQHIDWPSHKQDCRLLARQRNNSRMQQLQQAVAAANLNSIEQSFTNPVNYNNAGLMSTNVVQSGILSAVQPPSVIVSTTESEFMNGQAQSVMHRNNGFYGNLEANSTTADQLRLNPDGHLNDENKVLAQQNHQLQQPQFQHQEPQQQQQMQQQQMLQEQIKIQLQQQQIQQQQQHQHQQQQQKQEHLLEQSKQQRQQKAQKQQQPKQRQTRKNAKMRCEPQQQQQQQ